jgi:nicotinamidase-related amidase
VARTFPKGQDKRVDSYSGVFDNGRHAPYAVHAQFDFLGKSTGLAEYLIEQAEARGCDEIEVDCVGLALVFCVSFTAVDLAGLKYRGKNVRVRVVKDATRAIEFATGDYQKELDRLAGLGIGIVASADVVKRV